jgi:CRP-like cAMP-binding protein
MRREGAGDFLDELAFLYHPELSYSCIAIPE